jgi:hypothetical protein
VAFLLLCEEQQQQLLSWDQLACLVLWTVSVGIRTISLYDVRGLLKVNQARFMLRNLFGNREEKKSISGYFHIV